MNPFKSIMWIGIVVIILLALFGNATTKTALSNAEARINTAADDARQRRAEAEKKDPYAGTTQSREYQEAWERGKREVEIKYAYNSLTPAVRAMIGNP